MQSLRSILEMLRARSRHDLSFYKTNTLLRRIERRMAVHGIASIPAYEGYLRAKPAELDLMFREMLIGVTSFFETRRYGNSANPPSFPSYWDTCPALRPYALGWWGVRRLKKRIRWPWYCKRPQLKCRTLLGLGSRYLQAI